MDVETKSIKPIEQNAVHKICSGQVIFSLAVAVKELVENSLDAGATIVDIRLKNYGIDLIEVSDNGSGVTEDNFAALTLKYHTSKLSDYSDLLGVASYGFRGEALSSLCALSDLIVTTRHQDASYGTKIEYDHKGNIFKKTRCSRQVGTTVTLSNLFCSLPVRQKEFHKNVKREFNKMTQLLYAYCLICVGVKITCSNQTNSNNKSIVVSTQGSKSYKDNIACIFGLKQLQSLLEIKPECVSSIKDNILRGLSEDVEPAENSVQLDDIEIDLSEESSNDSQSKESESMLNSQKSQGYINVVNPIELTGFISSCEHGAGRSSTDRQFYYVNSRPCEPIKVIKLINEIYKQYNSNQYPFIFLNIELDRNFVDVNVSPDKRKVFLTKEKNILDALKTSIHRLFESIPRTIKLDTTNNCKTMSQEVKPELSQQRIYNSFMQQFSNKPSTNEESSAKIENNVELKRKSTSILDFVSSKTMKLEEMCVEVEPLNDILEENAVNENKEVITEIPCILENVSSSDKNKSEMEETKSNEKKYSDISTTKISTRNKLQFEEEINNAPTSTEMLYLDYTDDMPNTQIRNVADVITEKSHTIRCKTTSMTPKGKIMQIKDNAKLKKVVTDREDLGKFNRKEVTMKTSVDHVKQLFQIYNKQKSQKAPDRIKFKTTINPIFNKKCEEELTKEISKDSFKKMNVVGQFNLGFIVAQLEDDLFIVDQHATDEIYNFEMLQKSTELTSQKLVIPQSLELTGANEQILMDHVDVFKKNGFTFQIDENALPTKRVKLLTLPMSKNWVFGKDDIEELLFMLRESPTGPLDSCRPSRVRAMFASRACRKSVMVGTALTKTDMKKLLNHMGEIDKPWNCPHGRPTIRHLVNLAMVYSK